MRGGSLTLLRVQCPCPWFWKWGGGGWGGARSSQPGCLATACLSPSQISALHTHRPLLRGMRSSSSTGLQAGMWGRSGVLFWVAIFNEVLSGDGLSHRDRPDALVWH